ncbi:hypothetical protein, partial [Bradyrhizobium oropedii]|uniref:hypothetical protein n=1 Tax=Bradyrhizobium oropedii TaxID=1571201 RepID=UPI001E3A0583
ACVTTGTAPPSCAKAATSRCEAGATQTRVIQPIGVPQGTPISYEDPSRGERHLMQSSARQLQARSKAEVTPCCQTRLAAGKEHM